MHAVNAIQAFFAPIIAAYPFLVFFGTYISIILIGNVVSFATLWLAFQGNVRVGPFLGVVALVLFADISGDLAWYWLGRKLRGTKAGEFLYRHVPKHVEIEAHLQENAQKWIYLSKFIPSSTFAIIFSVGWAKIEFKKFWPVSLAAIVSSVAVLTVLAFGLSSGLSSLQAAAMFKRFERLFILAIVIFIAINFAIGLIFRKAVRKRKKQGG